MSEAPKLPIERARRGRRMRGIDAMRPLELGRYALETRAGRGGHLMDERAIRALMDEVTRLAAELEQRIDPARLEALTTHPPISITPMRGVSMAGDRWIISGGHGGRGVNYARSFPEALAIAEAHR